MRTEPTPSARRRRLRIAWICPFLPKPEFGGAVRCYYLIREAARRHDIDLLVVQEHEDVPRGFLADLRSIQFFRPDVTWDASKRLSVVSLQSQQRIATRSGELNEWLAVHGCNYDVVVTEFTRGAWAEIPAGPVRVLDMHNIEHELLLRTAAGDSQAVRRLYRWVDGQKLRREEKQVVGRFDLVATCSDRESGVVAKWAENLAVHTAPNGVDCPRFERPADFPRGTDLLFLGSMNYFPNEQGAKWFHDAILPIIRKRRPGTTIRIVGVNPTPALMALNSADFQIVGGVPDVRPEYWGARLLIVPLLSGSGTRLKILEAAGASLPVVTTRIGCEGIDFVNGEHGRIADRAEDFAQACIDLLGRDADRLRMAGNIRRLAAERYDWAAIATGLLERVNDLMDTVETRR